jgi:hypothetical protein
MQNKANFRKSQMNVSSSITMNYEQKTMNYANKNKANTKPIKANTKPIKAKTNPKQTQNKANTNPTCSELVEPISKDASLIRA